jgi:hypothetical protein
VGIAVPNKLVFFIDFCLLRDMLLLKNLLFDPDLPSLGVYYYGPLRTCLGDLMEERTGCRFSSDLSLKFASSFSTTNSDFG